MYSPSDRCIPLERRGLPTDDAFVVGDGTVLITCCVTWPPTLIAGSVVMEVMFGDFQILRFTNPKSSLLFFITATMRSKKRNYSKNRTTPQA